MAITYPYAGGWNESFAAVTTTATRDVGTGSNRRAVAILGYRGGSPTFPVPTTLTLGSDSVAASGSTFTDGTGNKFQLYVSSSDLTVTGSQTCTGSFSGGGGGPGGGALCALLVIKGDAALTIANILALLEQTVGGGGGSNSRTVTSVSGNTVIRMGVEFNGASATADSPATLITSSNAGKIFFKDTAAGSSTVMSATWGAFAEFVGTGFTVSEPAGAPVLTSPTGAATGNTTANAGATIDAVSGSGSRIMYALPRIGGSAASAATIIATGTQLAITSAGAKSVALTGLTPGASYSADVVYVDATTGTSNVVTGTWTQPTAPVLSSPTNTPGSTTALIGATTTVSSGTAYFLARVGGSAASAATIIATGQTSTVTTTTPSRTVTGLTASTANNYVDIVQVSGVTTSNVVSAGPFTTTASGDTTPPTLTGSIVIGTVTSSSIQMSWSAGSDNVAVTSYEVSSNGGSGYVDAGNVLTYTFTGLTASTSYGLRVRAKDAAGNVSTPALAATQSTAAASGVGSISLNNAALYTFKTNNGSAIVSMPVTFFVSNVTTGALIGSAITGLSTNAQGLVTTAISNASMLAGTTYRLSYEFSSGEYGSVKLPAV